MRSITVLIISLIVILLLITGTSFANGDNTSSESVTETISETTTRVPKDIASSERIEFFEKATSKQPETTTTTTVETATETTNQEQDEKVWVVDEEPNLAGLNVSIFSAESQYGITNEPSYSVTWANGTYVDKETGIRMNAQGDYLCAMGTTFGYCGDRFKVSMIMADETEKEFTVQIGDSKGDRWYHPYASGTEFEGYCVVEFIVDESIAWQYIGYTGSYHFLDIFNGKIIKISKSQ